MDTVAHDKNSYMPLCANCKVIVCVLQDIKMTQALLYNFDVPCKEAVLVNALHSGQAGGSKPTTRKLV